MFLNPISTHVFKTSVTCSKHLQRSTRFPRYLWSWRMGCFASGSRNTKQLCLSWVAVSSLHRTANKASGLDVFWDRSWRKGSCSQLRCVTALETVLCMPKEGICSSQVMGSCISHYHSFLICSHKLSMTEPDIYFRKKSTLGQRLQTMKNLEVSWESTPVLTPSLLEAYFCSSFFAVQFPHFRVKSLSI